MNRPDKLDLRNMLTRLLELSIDTDERVRQAVLTAKEDIMRASPDVDFPYGYFWFNKSTGLTVSNLHNAPFIGTIVKVTMDNMTEMASQTNVTNVVCLTEQRQVESLFEQCGAFLILEHYPHSLLCKRLRNQGIPFGMIRQEMMSKLTNEDHIMINQNMFTLCKK